MSHPKSPEGKAERARKTQGERRSETARHSTHPPVTCLSRTFLMLNSRKRRRGHVAGHPPAEFCAALPRGRLLRVPGELRPKVRVLGANRYPKPVQLAHSRAIRGMEGKRASANFFTERTLAAYLAVSDRTIRNWIRRGELPSYKLGASRRIDPGDVENFLAEHRDESA